MSKNCFFGLDKTLNKQIGEKNIKEASDDFTDISPK